MPIEKDFSPTLAGSDRAAQKHIILQWLMRVTGLIRQAASPIPIKVGLKVFNAVFDDAFQLEMLRAINERCGHVLESIGLADRRETLAESLSYAEMRALELGLTIAGNAHVILLDEPMAGMSRTEGERALELIRKISAGRTLLLVEHDMAVVFEIADRISVLVYGEIVATGTPAEIRANAAVQEAYLGQAAHHNGARP